MKLNVKLSKPNKPIIELIKQDHGLRGPILNWNNIQGSQLFVGRAYGKTPDWVQFLSLGTNADLGALRNEGSIALLFIPIDNRIMLFSFGYGNPKISASGWESDFGLKVVLNRINPLKVKSIDAKTVDTVVMNRRVQLSKENKIYDFGFEIDKDFLKSITGKSLDENFARVLSGSESLSITTNVQLGNFIGKVNSIYDSYNSNNYQEHFSWIDNIKSVKDDDLIQSLNEELLSDFNAILNNEDIDRYINVACPDIIDYSVVDTFRIRGYNNRNALQSIEIADVISHLQESETEEVSIENLTNYRIESLNEDGKILNDWPLYYWLVYECEYNGSLYVFSEGEWYFIHNNYFAEVNTKYSRIVNPRNGEYRALPPTDAMNEREYLDEYELTSSEFMFDSELSYIYGGRDSIEICDLYNSNKEFIHVKDGSGSSKLSHLFNQGYVSASMFVSDTNFRDDIIAKLRNAGKRRLSQSISIAPNPNDYTVVFRILKRGRQLTLPLFTKIVVIEMYRKIRIMGYKFRLEWVRKN